MLSLSAKNLKFLRTHLFLTQESFGSYFQLTRHQINSYEIGRANVPAELIAQLCASFKLSRSDFEQTDFATSLVDLSGVNKDSLERTNEKGTSSQVNEWREKYYTVLEKYNEALEELRRHKRD